MKWPDCFGCSSTAPYQHKGAQRAFRKTKVAFPLPPLAHSLRAKALGRRAICTMLHITGCIARLGWLPRWGLVLVLAIALNALCSCPGEGFWAGQPTTSGDEGAAPSRQERQRRTLMIVCRRCRWAGVVEDLSWGGCPECGGRKFADDFELCYGERLGVRFSAFWLIS